jgi:hypothetical protein
VTLVAWGGVGKTSLVAKWTADLAARDHDGADYFDWSFYSQGTRDQTTASGDPFVDAALRFFGDEETAESARSPWDKGSRLAELVASRRSLLVLDGLEPLQHPPGPLRGELKDPAVTALLKGLAQRNPGLCLVTTRERVADLAGSMMMAAAIGAVMSLVVVLLRGDFVDREQFAWLSIVSVVGAWAVLIPAKFWEGTSGDQALRRVTMLAIGLALGGVSFVAANELLVTFPDSSMRHIFNVRSFGNSFYDVKDGSPLLYAYLAYFGALFVSLRWWKQADPLRRTRLSVWTTGVAVLVAWLIHLIWPFPQPWGLMVAAIISASVQLVSPFVPLAERGAAQPSVE